ncbi:spermidine/putrescine-binding protein [Mycoplasmoides fastidiosum]|uniref:Spermidine/putrescine-binding protein n=1 Tax=Mycoplasmoides fastidiosum TaxID=92758 RepID=A0ABU0LZ33_9BACT|nr:hypothetical protein [Mycoplasmoides fastidiosum]MDQ0513868.1 spermidine/putrescine-binding protein [Mycoplasmoides fastidiosum]UUD37718.1 hypothetical protein NPA10_04075 [Mycoplasmoides fastidiosum]
MRKKMKQKWLALSGLSTLGTAIVLSACGVNANSNDGSLILGNYQSYISPWLENNLGQKYNMSFNYFNTAEEVPSRYRLNNYDASIVSSSVLENLIKVDLVKKLDWSFFGIKDSNGDLITNATQALTLFTKPVQEILTNIYTRDDGTKINLLDYGIPYFLQTFNFAYRGEAIPALHENEKDLKWSDILKAISENDRFKSRNNIPQLGVVNDPRTLLSIANLMNPNTLGVNPDLNNGTIANLESAFDNFTRNGINRGILGNNPVLLNADSTVIVNQLAAPTASLGSSAGGFMYNGDILFTANGGDNQTEIDGDDLHIVKNQATLYALDLINFSSQVPETFTNNKPTAGSKLDRLYKMARSLSLEGSDTTESMLAESEKDENLTAAKKAELEQAISNNCTENCISYDANLIDGTADDDGKYIYGPMINFNYVQYTPVLTKMYNEILGVPLNPETAEPDPAAAGATGTDAAANSGTTTTTPPTSTDTTPAVDQPTVKITDDNVTLEQVEQFIEDSYFYEPPTEVFFGRKESGKTDYNNLNASNWEDYLSSANFDDGSDAETDPATVATKKLVVTEATLVEKRTPVENGALVHNYVRVSYEIQSIANPDEKETHTQEYLLSQTAEQHLAEAIKPLKEKALLMAKILIINYFPEMNKFVEKDLPDILRSNLLIAFNELKSAW